MVQERLKGPAVGPDGSRAGQGDAPLSGWPAWFVEDLRAHGQLEQGKPNDTSAQAGAPTALSGTSRRGRGGRS